MTIFPALKRIQSVLASVFATCSLFLCLFFTPQAVFGFDLSFVDDPLVIEGDHFILYGDQGTLTITGVTAECRLLAKEPLPSDINVAIVLQRDDATVTTQNLPLSGEWTYDRYQDGYYYYQYPLTYSYTLPTPGLMSYNLRSDDNYTFLLTLSASGTESDPTNNSISSDIFAYKVFSGNLYFGNELTRLSSLSFSGDLYYIYPTYYPVLGPSNATWEGSLGTYPFDAEGLAVLAQDITSGFTTNLIVVHGEIILTNIEQAGIGNLTVQISNTTLDPTGLTVSSPRLIMPPGHSVHLVEDGRILAAGRPSLAFSSSNFDGTSLEVDLPEMAIHGPGLPFYLKTAARNDVDILNGSALVLTGAQTVYVHQAALNGLADGDSRTETGLPANDIMFSRAYSTDVSLTSGGLSGSVDFNGNSGDSYNNRTSFPKGSLEFSAFHLDLDNSVISSSSGLDDPVFSLEVVPGCPDSSCSERLPGNLSYTVMSPGAGMLANGALGAGFSQLYGETVSQSASPLEWGYFIEEGEGELSGTFIREDKTSGVWTLPGFIMPQTADNTSGEISQVLLGSLLFGDPTTPVSLHRLHDSADPAADRGDGYFAGINLGPEYFNDAALGIGSFLNGETEIRFYGNSTHVAMPDKDRTKYVVRQGGVTGAFNTSFTGTTSVYGYDITFANFSFKQDRNLIDQDTGIDGELTLNGLVGGDSGMRVGFFDLDLSCNGSLGSGTIDNEPEPTWPDCKDDNDNDGRENEGCHVLHYWKVPIFMAGMAFVNDPDADDADTVCPAGPKVLQLQTVNNIEALSKALDMTALYTTEGDLERQSLVGEVVSLFDKPKSGDKPGFTMRLQRAYLDQPRSTPDETDGYAVVSGLVDVPVFNDVAVMGHLDNMTPNSGDGALYVFGDDTDRDGDRNGIPDIAYYEDLGVSGYRGLLTDTSITEYPHPELHYFWPSTDLLDFQYYAKFNRSLLGNPPKFSGFKKELNIFNLLKLQAVPDFLEPERAKFSFGASADIDAMKAAFVELSNHVVGLNDYLHDLGVDSSFDLEELFGGVVDASSELHKICSGDLSLFLWDVLEAPLRSGLEDLVADMADRLTEAHQAAFGLEGAINGPLLALQSDLTETISPLLEETRVNTMIDDYAAVALYGSERLRLPGVSGVPLGFNWSEAEQAVDAFRAGLDDAIGQTEDIVDTITTTLRSLCGDDAECKQGTLEDIQTALAEADEAIKDLQENLVPAGFGPFLSYNNSNPIVAKIDLAKDTVKSAKQKLKAFNIKATLQAIHNAAASVNITLDPSSFDDLETELTSVKQTITSLLDKIEPNIIAADNAIGEFYSSAPFDILYKLTNTDNDGILDKNGIPRKKIKEAQDAVIGLQARFAYLGKHLPDDLEQIKPLLAMLREVVDGDESLPTGADWDACMTISQQKFDDAVKEFNRVVGKKDFEDCTQGDDGGACFKAAFGPNAVSLTQWLVDPLLADMGDDANEGLEKFFTDLQKSILDALPMPTPEDINNMIVAAIMNNETIKELNETFYTLYSPIKEQLDEVSTQTTLTINKAIIELTMALNEAVGDQLASLLQMGPEDGANPLAALAAAKINGYAILGLDEIEQIHLETEFSLKPDPNKPISFFVAVDVTAWGAENGKAGCMPEGDTGDYGDYYDVSISTKDVSAEMLGAPVGIKWALLGITIAGTPPPDFPLQISPCPVGVFGGIYTLGGFDLEAVQLMDLGLECGFGPAQKYLGATCRGSFDSFAVPMAAFYLGRSCGSGVITRLDKQVGDFIELDANSPLEGVYVRASVEIPLYSYGCLCEIGAGIDVGGWYFTEPSTYGGLLGGILFGRLGCVGYVKGKLLCMLEPAGDKTKYAGSAWAAAGAGLCKTGSWRTVEDVRADGPFCFTADTTFGVTYIDDFEIEEPTVNCCD